MITIKDIAKHVGVSMATVSRVINHNPKVNPDVTERVQQAIKELGYRPNANARALASRQHGALGLVMADLHGAFFSSLAKGVEEVCRERQSPFLVSTGGLHADTERAAIELLLEQRCKALVVHSKFLDGATLVELSKEAPIVLINRYIPELEDRCVWLDNETGGELMARYLVGCGHRQFVLLNSDQAIEDPGLRLKGMQQVLAQAGIPLTEERIIYQKPDQEGGEAAIHELLSRKLQFSAVLAYNDTMALGAMSMLQDYGFSVPGQISVVGFDDVLFAKYCRPKLTTLKYPVEEMAELAANLALDLAADSESAKCGQKRFIPTLIKRESVRNLDE